MRTGAARAALGAALLIAAIVLFVVLQDGDDEGAAGGGGYGGAAATEDRAQRGAGEEAEGTAPEPARPSIPTVVVRDGEPVGGVARLEFSAGERIRFAVRSDVVEEVHVHGYDFEVAVTPGAPARFDFAATIEGLFEVELHGSGVQIAELRVNP